MINPGWGPFLFNTSGESWFARVTRLTESRAERLARWRCDAIIAAAALVTGLTLIHNNPSDFEAIRSRIETDPERFSHVGSLNLIRCGVLRMPFEGTL